MSIYDEYNEVDTWDWLSHVEQGPLDSELAFIEANPVPLWFESDGYEF